MLLFNIFPVLQSSTPKVSCFVILATLHSSRAQKCTEENITRINKEDGKGKKHINEWKIVKQQTIVEIEGEKKSNVHKKRKLED